MADSPCINVCTLDGNDICMGCGRSLTEIARWREMTAAEQRRVLEAARRRLDVKNDAGGGEGV